MSFSHELQAKPLYVSDKRIFDIPLATQKTASPWGWLPYVKHGKLVKYSVADVIAYLEARKINAEGFSKVC